MALYGTWMGPLDGGFAECNVVSALASMGTPLAGAGLMSWFALGCGAIVAGADPWLGGNEGAGAAPIENTMLSRSFLGGVRPSARGRDTGWVVYTLPVSPSIGVRGTTQLRKKTDSKKLPRFRNPVLEIEFVRAHSLSNTVILSLQLLTATVLTARFVVEVRSLQGNVAGHTGAHSGQGTKLNSSIIHDTTMASQPLATRFIASPSRFLAFLCRDCRTVLFRKSRRCHLLQVGLTVRGQADHMAVTVW